MATDVQILGTLYVASTRSRLQLDHDSVKVITKADEAHRFPLDGIVTVRRAGDFRAVPRISPSEG